MADGLLDHRDSDLKKIYKRPALNAVKRDVDDGALVYGHFSILRIFPLEENYGFFMSWS